MRPPALTHIDTPQSACGFALAWGDITPPPNIYHRMWGAAKHERATGIHRPLRATVAVFAAAGLPPSPPARQLLLALDHCTLGATELEQLLAHISAATGQPRETILVAFSHTHGAGLMGLERASLPGGDLIAGYLKSVAERAAALVQEALAKLRPATIVYGTGHCDLAGHRDFWDEARQQFVCGFNPAERADDTVLVARVTGTDGKLLATVVNYACHPTTLAWENTLISPDFPGAMREVIEQATGAPCLFLQGACGELGPREGFVGDTAVADRNGRQLGYAALSALTALPEAGTRFEYAGPVISGATLGAWKHEPLLDPEAQRKQLWQHWRWHEPLPYRPGQPPPEQIAADLKKFQDEEQVARANGDTQRAAECRAMVERKTRLQHRLGQLPPGSTFPLQVALWRIGDAFWLVAQGESYSQLQTELRARFPQATIVVTSIAADWGAAYLPPRQLYDTGIYQETIAVVEAGSLEQLIESVAQRVDESLRNEWAS